jgi:hypothetical protein
MLIWLVEKSFGLISTDLWGGQTDLHFKEVFISPFLSFDWSMWKYCGVVGLICNLREFLWGGPTDLHFIKGSFYQSISFILIGQFEIIDNSYWLIFLDWFVLIRGWGVISPWKLQNSCKAVFHIPVYEGFS